MTGGGVEAEGERGAPGKQGGRRIQCVSPPRSVLPTGHELKHLDRRPGPSRIARTGVVRESASLEGSHVERAREQNKAGVWRCDMDRRHHSAVLLLRTFTDYHDVV